MSVFGASDYVDVLKRRGCGTSCPGVGVGAVAGNGHGVSVTACGQLVP
jgi:hypothetical protein